MITTQTFEFNKSAKREMEVLSQALELIGKGLPDEAAKVLIARHDELTKDPILKAYDQREP